MNRRSFLTSAASFGLLGSSLAHANERVVIQPNTELALRSDLYARLARNGNLTPAQVPVRVTNKTTSQETLVYVSPDARTARLIVFSHGAVAEPRVYAPLLEFLTTHGFCVVAPLHSDGPIQDLRDQRRENGWGFPELMTDMGIWERRMQQCIEARDSHERLGSTINVDIDATYPIFMGHSFGAMTGLLLSGVKASTPNGTVGGEATEWAGRILLSPPGNGVFGLDEGSWSDLSSPTLTVTNSKDQGIIAQPPAKKLDSYYLPPEGYRHLAYLQGGGPSIYSGQRARPKTKEYFIFFDLRGSISAFVSAYGKRDVEAFRGLYDGSIEDRSYRFAAIRSR